MSFAIQKQLPPDIVGSLECEMSILATLLFNGGRIASCEGLGPQHFVEPLFGRMFEAIEKQALEGVIQPLILAHQFANDEGIKSLGVTSRAFFANLAANANIPAAVPHLARQIKDGFAFRQLAEKTTAFYQRAMEPQAGDTAETVIATAMEALSAILNEAGMGNTRPHAFTLYEAVDALAIRLNDKLMNGVVADQGVHPGSRALAGVIGTWKRGRYYVLGGRPGMGKSTVATSWLAQSALKGANILFFSLEMPVDEVAERIVSDFLLSSGHRIEYVKINHDALNGPEAELVIEGRYELKNLGLTIVDRPALTLAQLRAIALKHKQALEARGRRLDVICIDHTGLMKASERYLGNKVAETEENSIALKAMAKEFDCAVLALAQLNRASEQREDKRPSLSDLRWSGSIEQDADVVMFAYRPAYYLERKKCDDLSEETERKQQLAAVKNDLEIIFAKHRGGPCPILEFECDIACSAVRDRQ